MVPTPPVGGGAGGQDSMSVDLNLIQQQRQSTGPGPGLSPPAAASQQMYNSYQPSPTPPNPYGSQQAPPSYSSNPSTPSYPPQQQSRPPYPNPIAPSNHRPSTPNSQSYPQPPNPSTGGYPSHPTSNSYPVPGAADYSGGGGRHYDPSLSMELDPYMQSQHTRSTAPYPQQPINNRPAGPSAHHPQSQQPYSYDPQTQTQYEQQHMLPPNLSPSPSPPDRGVSPLPPATNAQWLKQVYGKYPQHNDAMAGVLGRHDLDEQQKVQMFQHILQREIRQSAAGPGGMRGDEGVSPVPLGRG